MYRICMIRCRGYYFHRYVEDGGYYWRAAAIQKWNLL